MAISEFTGYDGPTPYFAIPVEHIPYKKYDIDESVDFGIIFENQWEGEIVDIKKELLKYYSIAEFYINYLDTVCDNIIKNQIFDRFYKITDEFTDWQRKNKDDVNRVLIPYELGEMLAERENYDEAILVFYNSTGEIKKREEAIERCKYKRDGFIYDELKKMLRGLSEIEQKQLIGYGRVFKIEIRLRDVVDKTMTIVRNTNRWLENDSNPNLKTVIIDCKDRFDRYQKDCFNKEMKPVRFIDFTTLPELESIIRENWKHFQEEFKSHEFFNLLGPVKNIRLDIAHARFLDDTQLATLSNRFDELDRVLALKRTGENQNTPFISSSRSITDNQNELQ